MAVHAGPKRSAGLLSRLHFHDALIFFWPTLTPAQRDNITAEDLKIPHPPLPEQRAIATVLSDVDALLGGLDRLIAKKRDLKRAAMQQLLTGQTRLPGFHGEWEVKTFGDLRSTFGGLTGKTKADFGDGAGQYVTFLCPVGVVTVARGRVSGTGPVGPVSVRSFVPLRHRAASRS